MFTQTGIKTDEWENMQNVMLCSYKDEFMQITATWMKQKRQMVDDFTCL